MKIKHLSLIVVLLLVSSSLCVGIVSAKPNRNWHSRKWYRETDSSDDPVVPSDSSDDPVVPSDSSDDPVVLPEGEGEMPQVKAIGNTFSVPLRGVNCEGMEYWPYADDLREEYTPAVYEGIKSWGFTCVRHPYAIDLYNYDTFYRRGEDLGVEYRAVMTEITQYCLDNELYIIWDFHRWRYNVEGSYEVQDVEIYERTMYNIAIQLKDYPNVILELANEPMDNEWIKYAQIGIDAMRNAGYTGLILVPISSGPASFIYDPLIDPLNNFAYDYHEYWYWREWSDGKFTANTVDGIYNWFTYQRIVELAESRPLLIGEFGAYAQKRDEIEFLVNMATLCEREGWGWLVWSYKLDSETVWGIRSDWDTLNTSGEALVNYLNTLL